MATARNKAKGNKTRAKVEFVKSVRALKEDTRRTSNRVGATRIPTEGITVRFLTEPEEGWIKYAQHYIEAENRYIPCMSESCPGCMDGVRRTTRHLANALLVETSTVAAIELPSPVVQTLIGFHSRYGGTLCDRNYFLSKEGAGIETTYQAIPDSPSPVRTSRYELIDLISVIESMIPDDDEDDDDDDDDEYDEPPRKQSVGGRTATRPNRRYEDEEDEPVRKAPVRRPAVDSTSKRMKRIG